MSVNIWSVVGNIWFLRNPGVKNVKLDSKQYHVSASMEDGMFLVEGNDRFEFPYKIYGKETDLIKRVLKSYKNTEGNLGVLLNGIKGTGKTVTSKLLCNFFNELGLPVIIVTQNFGKAFNDFLNSIHQDVVILIDEYEKLYTDDSDKDKGDILTIMDGALDNGFRKVFLLTTNKLFINDNLIQRPGRIRYLKTFKDLESETIIEVVDDKLIHKDLRDVTIEFISTLETITIDIVKAVVDEVNIHQENPKNFKDVFNIKVLNKKINVFKVFKDNNGAIKEEMVGMCTSFNNIPNNRVTKKFVGREIYIDEGTISLGNLISISDDGKLIDVRKVIRYLNDEEIDNNTLITLKPTEFLIKDGDAVFEKNTYRIEEVNDYHNSFRNSYSPIAF